MNVEAKWIVRAPRNIKAVILDYGEVISAIRRPRKEWGRMADLFHVERDQFRPLWDRNRLQYDRGDLSLETYWAKLAEDAGTQIGARATQKPAPMGR